MSHIYVHHPERLQYTLSYILRKEPVLSFELALAKGLHTLDVCCEVAVNGQESDP